MDSTLVITAVLTAVLAGLIGYWFFLKQKDKDSLDKVTVAVSTYKERLKAIESRLDALHSAMLATNTGLEVSLTRKIEYIERTAISETRVRDLIVEETRELKGEMKALSELISKLRVDLGILNYINNKE